MAQEAAQQLIAQPTLSWEAETGYDFFTSLDVLHNPDRYGLRGSWAAGVRSRLPSEQRDVLQTLMKKNNLWAIPWLARLEGPKDAYTVLERLAAIPAAERLPTLLKCYHWEEMQHFLLGISKKQGWGDEDADALKEIYQSAYKKEGIKRKISSADLEETLTIWANTEQFGEGLIDALRTYYDVFFHEEEKRILPALKETTHYAQELAEQMPLEALLNELSQGLRFEMDKTKDMQQLLMVPSFWTTPLTLFTSLDDAHTRWIFMFGGRPASQSLVPGEVVPELLHQTLKALADPTRLRILRYLSQEPLAPAELARRLRLRPPTVIHHLDALRLARLVHVTLSHDGRKYEARREAIDATCGLLNQFLDE